MRRLAVVALALVTPVLSGACRSDTVRIAFQPEVGDEYAYEVHVESETVTRVGDRPEERSEDSIVLRADHAVLASGPEGIRVQVQLRRVDGGDPRPRTFVVLLDRAGQLDTIERIEGLPSSVLGGLGLAEVLPSGAELLPDRALDPGQRWTIDEPVRLAATAAPAPSEDRLRGSGRLVQLGVTAGRHVATVQTTVTVPVQQSTTEQTGRRDLAGLQTTEATTTYAVDGGAVQEARARTEGRFRVRYAPPDPAVGEPVEGTLTVEVRSATKRVS